jgi:hypothetical protein
VATRGFAPDPARRAPGRRPTPPLGQHHAGHGPADRPWPSMKLTSVPAASSAAVVLS